jgi:hypothetical protein
LLFPLPTLLFAQFPLSWKLFVSCFGFNFEVVGLVFWIKATQIEVFVGSPRFVLGKFFGTVSVLQIFFAVPSQAGEFFGLFK